MDFFCLDLATPLPLELGKVFKGLSGKVASGGRRIWVGLNAAWLVDAALRHYGVKVKQVTPPKWLATPPLTQTPNIPEMMWRVSGFESVWPSYLLPWQSQLIHNYAHRPGVHLWWAPGAGKTVGTLAWSLLGSGGILYVTRSGARRTIAADAKRFTNVSHMILAGESSQTLPSEVRLIITGWDTLSSHVESIRAWQPTTVVFDEIHRAKSHKRLVAVPKRDANGNYEYTADGSIKNEFKYRENMTAAAKLISTIPSVKRRIGATASPIKDRLRDLWAQLDLVEPEQWGFFYDYARRYCDAKEGSFGGINTSGRASNAHVEELLRRLSFSVHQVPYAVTHAHLPPKRRQVTYLSKDVLNKDEGAEARAFIRESDVSPSDRLKAHARLAAAAARKQSAVIDEVMDNLGEKNKIVILTGLRGACERLHAALRKRLDKDRPEVQSWWGHGDTPEARRDEIQQAYMASEGPCVLVGTMQTWGESLNLQDTDIAYLVMLPYTPGEVEQVEGRFSRQGQRRPCLIHYLVAEGTYDEHVAQILIDKMPSVERVIGDGGSLDGFRRAIGGIENEEAMIASIVGKIVAGTYEIEEDSR